MTAISRTVTLATMTLATALLPVSGFGLEIYTWVDEDGVVHYSESAPDKPAATPVETLQIAAANSPAYDPDDYYWSILNQADRIGEQWSAIQEEKAEAEAEARATAAATRIEELERQLAAHEAAEYATAARPFYGPYAFFPKRHYRPLDRGRHARPARGAHPAPRSDRDPSIPDRAPRPGWTPPRPPSSPPTPGFSR